MSAVTSTEANRNFSRLLAKTRLGEVTEITVRGVVIAKLVPVSEVDTKASAEKLRKWDEFIERLRSQPVLNIPRGTRDELYDE